MAKQIKLVKSLISCKKNQIETAHSLGLRKIGDVTNQPDNRQWVKSRQFLTSLRLRKYKARRCTEYEVT